MKASLKSAALAVMLMAGATANAGIIPITGNGDYMDSVEGDSGWFLEDTFGGLDFWTLEVTHPAILSLEISSDIVFGISVYEGEIMEDFGIVFNNDSDFSDFFNDLAYLGGTDPLVPGSGNSLQDIRLSSPGFYTIAVGGNEGLMNSGIFDYTLSVNAVPEPAAALLLLIGVAGLITRRRAA